MFLFFLIPHAMRAISSLAKNDGYPVFTTLDPHTFLHTHEKLRIKAPYFSLEKNNAVGLSVAAYGQLADSGRDRFGNKFFPPGKHCIDRQVDPNSITTTTPGGITTTSTTNPPDTTCKREAMFPVELGDITGRLNMITLLLGNRPDGQDLTPTLQNAFNELSPDELLIDPTERFGHFSIPLKYRKYGIRFDLSIHLLCGFGLNLRAGIASIHQSVDHFRDMTCFARNECPFIPFPDEVGLDDDKQVKFRELKAKITRVLMNPLCDIAQELKLDIVDFKDSSIDELRFSLFWRQAHELNAEREEWPHIIATPFFLFTGSFSPVKLQDTSKVFSVPFGNNRHTAVGLDVGLNFDFVETIEIGAEVGVVHFFDKNFCGYRVPNHVKQRVFFPFTTDVNIQPGRNWHFAAKIAAFHFLDKLSMYFQYVMVEHKEDTVRLLDKSKCKPPCSATLTDDTVFQPQVLEEISAWKTKVANVGFNYDISPNIGLGFLWQAPLTQRNSYRTSTVMLGLCATF